MGIVHVSGRAGEGQWARGLRAPASRDPYPQPAEPRSGRRAPCPARASRGGAAASGEGEERRAGRLTAARGRAREAGQDREQTALRMGADAATRAFGGAYAARAAAPRKPRGPVRPRSETSFEYSKGSKKSKKQCLQLLGRLAIVMQVVSILTMTVARRFVCAHSSRRGC